MTIKRMTPKQIAIADMQCRVFRNAQKKRKDTPVQCARLFKDYDLTGYISDCYDLLHGSSHQNALEEIEDFLHLFHREASPLYGRFYNYPWFSI